MVFSVALIVKSSSGELTVRCISISYRFKSMSLNVKDMKCDTPLIFVSIHVLPF